MGKPLVSIALCTYNGAIYLKEQLDSLIAQTYSTIEIVVVDDRSTDDTWKILTGYANTYPQFKIYQNLQNLGFVKNFERAAGLCSGELIALCDQDDIWHPEKIALQVESIGDNLLIYHDSEFIHADGSPMNKKISDRMNFYRGSDPLAFLFFNCVSGHGILMRRELLKDALPLQEGYFHDWWLAYVATNIGRIDFILQALVKYRQHEKSDTNMLGLQREKDNYRHSSVFKLEKQYKWLSLCAAFEKNRNPALIDAFFSAYKKRMNTFASFDLARLLYKYMDIIFFVRKKSRKSKLNYIFQQVWGTRSKKIVGTK